MLLSLAQKVTMDLIRNDPNAVAPTEVTHLAQFLLTPHSACRIVRMAQDKKLYVLRSIRQLSLHIFKIHRIITFLLDKGTVKYLPPVIVPGMFKRCISRGMDQDIFSRLRQQSYQAIECRDDPRRDHQIFFLDGPLISSTKPRRQHRKITIVVYTAVSQDLAIQMLPNSVQDLWRCSKVHIGYP